MLIYEITATVEKSLAEGFESFMAETHIPAVLATGCFSAAFFAKNDDVYRIGYHCESRSALDDYYRHHAGRLRAEMTAKFPDGAEFKRNELEIVKLFHGS